MRLDDRQQERRFDGLGQNANGAELGLVVLGHRMPAQHDGRNASELRIAELRVAKLEAGHSRHMQVEKDQSRAETVAKGLPRVAPIVERVYRVAGLAEQVLHDLQHVAVVIKHQDGHRPTAAKTINPRNSRKPKGRRAGVSVRLFRRRIATRLFASLTQERHCSRGVYVEYALTHTGIHRAAGASAAAAARALAALPSPRSRTVTRTIFLPKCLASAWLAMKRS